MIARFGILKKCGDIHVRKCGQTRQLDWYTTSSPCEPFGSGELKVDE